MSGIRLRLAPLYLVNLEGKSARTIDLRRALEGASGRDLGEFFQRWVYATAPDPLTPRRDVTRCRGSSRSVRRVGNWARMARCEARQTPSLVDGRASLGVQ